MAFFALSIPGDLQLRLAEGLASLKHDWPDVQWVHPEDYHLTLRFIGGLQPPAMARLLAEVESQGLPFSPFEIKLRGLSFFPPQRDRGVLWIGLEAHEPALMDLQARLELQVQALGFEAEKRAFTPHLTIGRFKDRDAAGLMKILPDFAGRNWGAFICHEYVLMKRRSGARDRGGRALYEVLTRF